MEQVPMTKLYGFLESVFDPNQICKLVLTKNPLIMEKIGQRFESYKKCWR